MTSKITRALIASAVVFCVTILALPKLFLVSYVMAGGAAFEAGLALYGAILIGLSAAIATFVAILDNRA